MIHLFWATCRPKMMRETYYYWMNKCVHPENVRLHIAVDDKKAASYLSDFEEVSTFPNPNRGVVKPVYNLTKDFKGEPNDIMVVPSDDFYPPTNWDMYLLEKFEEFNFKGVLKVNDGHMDDIISIPIMKYEAFVSMGNIIYHPAYDHMFCDKELHDTAFELGIAHSVERGDPEWVHRHPHFKSRDADSHDDHNNSNYKLGKDIYTKRRYMTLRERMTV